MSRSIVVIGAGIAGLSAAWAARRQGAEVTVVNKSIGASAFAGGAVDDSVWEQVEQTGWLIGKSAPIQDLPQPMRQFVTALGLWDIPSQKRPQLATLAGRIRLARGRDKSLLDLSNLHTTQVLVPRVDRPQWDADLLARSLNEEPFSRSHKVSWIAMEATILRYDEERHIADGDLAMKHNDDGRLHWLAAQLRRALKKIGKTDAILLGPWLGSRLGRAEELSKEVGVTVGEALMGVGSPAGLRFETARDAMLKALNVTWVLDQAMEVASHQKKQVSIKLSSGASLLADAVILAPGGLVGGGLVYSPAESIAGADLPERVNTAFGLSVQAPVVLDTGSTRLDITSSLHGPEMDGVAWPGGMKASMLESVGIRCKGVEAASRIYAAGDVIAGRPRTVLEAVATGLVAGSQGALSV